MDPQIIDFIQKAKASSLSDADIKSSLESAGWQPQDIEQALASFSNTKDASVDSLVASVQSRPTSPSVIHKGRAIALFVVICVLLVAGITTAYILLKPSKAPSGVVIAPTTTPLAPPETTPSSIPSQTQPIVVNNIRNILAYTETPESGTPPVLVFYDINKKQRLPPDPVIEADKNYMIQLGPWSPDGQYLPILAYTGPASTDYAINLYLFDVKTLRATKIYGAPSNEENRNWANTSFSFTSAWLDNTKLVLKDTRDVQGVLISVTYITTGGEIITSPQSNTLRKVSKQLEYSFSSGALSNGNVIQSIKVGTTTLAFVPEGDVVGVVDGMLAVLIKPKPMYFDGMTDQGISSDLQKQMEELEKLGLTEEELSRRALELMQPKGETTLNLYSLGDGTLTRTISLADGTWQVQSALVQPSGKTLVAHQTDNVIQASKQRFILVSPSNDPTTRVLFEEDLPVQGQQPYVSLLAFQGASFLLSTDGNYIIGMRNGVQGNPENSIVGWERQTIFMRNIDTGEEGVVCASNCFDMRVHYPYHLMMRY